MLFYTAYPQFRQTLNYISNFLPCVRTFFFPPVLTPVYLLFLFSICSWYDDDLFTLQHRIALFMGFQVAHRLHLRTFTFFFLLLSNARGTLLLLAYFFLRYFFSFFLIRKRRITGLFHFKILRLCSSFPYIFHFASLHRKAFVTNVLATHSHYYRHFFRSSLYKRLLVVSWFSKVKIIRVNLARSTRLVFFFFG